MKGGEDGRQVSEELVGLENEESGQGWALQGVGRGGVQIASADSRHPGLRTVTERNTSCGGEDAASLGECLPHGVTALRCDWCRW